MATNQLLICLLPLLSFFVRSMGTSCEAHQEFVRFPTDRCKYIVCEQQGSGFSESIRLCPDGYSVHPDFDGGFTDPCTELDEECGHEAENTTIELQRTDSDNLLLTFYFRGELISLNLTKSQHVVGSVPVNLISGGQIKTWVEQELTPKFNIYTDIENEASISVTDMEDGVGDNLTTVRGTFTRNQSTYMLRPLIPDGMELTGLRNQLRQFWDGLYRVFKVNVHNISTGNEDELLDFDTEAPSLLQSPYDDMSLELQRSDFHNYGIETIVVADYSMFESYYNMSNARSESDRINDAMYYLTHYLIMVMNSVDMRYQGIDDPEIGLHIRLNGIIIAQDRESSPWAENNLINDTNIQVDSALKEFRMWLMKNKASLPKHDQATTVSWYSLFKEFEEGERVDVLGQAYYDSICRNNSVTINHDLGEQSTALTIAHELGHTLSARHDGDGNSCNHSSLYIMANRSELANSSMSKNAYMFSSCSIQSFKRHIRTLNLRKSNCMMKIQGKTINHGIDTPIGMMYNPDDQCRRIYGEESFYCAGAENDARICGYMMCFNPAYGRCTSHSDIRAGTGTPCGDRKWCTKSECLSDGRAPEGKDECMYGDYKAELPYLNKTCREYIRERPWECYRDHINKRCCESCAQIAADNNNKDCPYGDRSDWCVKNSLRWYCYSNTTQHHCCNYCPPKRKNLPGCEYGDQADWCQRITKSSCYVNDKVCCERCAAWDTGDPECKYGDHSEECIRRPDINCDNPYWRSYCCFTCTGREPRAECKTGDKAGWCRNIATRDCYVSERTCCATCPGRRRNHPGCEYGDRLAWCDRIQRRECYSDYFKKECCDWCRRSVNGPIGCEYGDQDPECSRDRCSDKSVRKRCCRTCAGFVNLAPPAPDVLKPLDVCPKDGADWCYRVRPAECYHSGKLCCRSCAAYRRDDIQGCEYGDRSSHCFRMRARDCYSDNTRRECCETCHRYRTNNPDCLFGDRRDDCFKLDCSVDHVRRDCCSSCGTQVVSTPAPDLSKCTDSFNWCKDMHPGRCYKFTERRMCCSTCARKRAERVGCEYGDRKPWCRKEFCETAKRTCCATCR